MAENVSANDPDRTFIEESAMVFKVPAFILLAVLTLAGILAGTWVTAELLDSVLLAFSQAAATKSESFIGSNFRNLVAAGIWFFALVLLFRQARAWMGGDRSGASRSRLEQGAPFLLIAALVLLLLIWPGAFGLFPLWVPLGLLAALGLLHVFTRTRITAIALRELSTLLMNPLGYVVLTMFSVVLAILFFGAVDRLAGAGPTSEINIAPLKALFGTADVLSRELNFLVIALLLIIPVITMRLIAEEKRSGTEEVLLTAPVREWHVVVGKFSGTMLFFMLMWGLAIVPFWFLDLLGDLDWRQVLSSYIGLFFIGFGLVGLGVLASSLTRNQLAAAVVTFLGMLLFTFQTFTTLPSPGGDFAWLRTAALYLDIRQHLAWVARGTIDSRTVFLFLSCGLFTLFLAVRALETRRWAGFSLARRLTPSRAVIGILGLAAVLVILIITVISTGKAQVAEKLAFRKAADEAVQAGAEEAGPKPAGKPNRPGALFREDETVKKTGDRIAPAAGEEDKKKTDPEPEDKKKAEGDSGKKGEAVPAPGKTDAPEGPAASTPSQTLAPPEAEWTYPRILKVLGTGLILLMLYLALFARFLSGGLRNQIVFGSNVMVGSLAALILVVLANYLATRNHKAVDLSRGQVYSLAPAVKDAIDGVLLEGETVEVTALVGRYTRADDREEVDDNIRRGALEQIFQKFAEALNRPGVLRFNAAFVDPEKEKTRTKELINEYNISGRHEVIIRYRDRHEILHNDDLFNMVRNEKRFDEFLVTWRNMIRRGRYGIPPLPPTRMEQFQLAELWMKQQGNPDYLRTVRPKADLEKTLGEVIVQLVKSPGNNLYFTVGHGEKNLDIRRKAAELAFKFGEASLLRRALSVWNFNLLPLEPLTGDREVPERCNFLLVAGPTRPFAGEEIRKIQAYVEGGGHLIVFTEAGHDSGLEPLLKSFGLEVEASQIWLGGPPGDRRMAMMGQMRPITPMVVATLKPAKKSRNPQNPDFDHPITRALSTMASIPLGGTSKGARALMLLASPIRISRSGEAGEKWKASPLLEVNFLVQGRDMLRPYATKDLDKPQTTVDRAAPKGPFDVAVLCEPVEARAEGGAGKVLVVGDTDFIEDRVGLPEAFGMQQTGNWSPFGELENSTFMQVAFDFLKKRPTKIDVDIKPPRVFAGDFKAPSLKTSRWVLWLCMPAFFLFLGFLVFFVRRRA